MGIWVIPFHYLRVLITRCSANKVLIFPQTEPFKREQGRSHSVLYVLALRSHCHFAMSTRLPRSALFNVGSGVEKWKGHGYQEARALGGPLGGWQPQLSPPASAMGIGCRNLSAQYLDARRSTLSQGRAFLIFHLPGRWHSQIQASHCICAWSAVSTSGRSGVTKQTGVRKSWFRRQESASWRTALRWASGGPKELMLFKCLSYT